LTPFAFPRLAIVTLALLRVEVVATRTAA